MGNVLPIVTRTPSFRALCGEVIDDLHAAIHEINIALSTGDARRVKVALIMADVCMGNAALLARAAAMEIRE
jgi:hypothetical protein